MKNKFVLKKCEFIQSPNYDDRPKSTVVDTIIIHCISLPEGKYDNDNVNLLFLNNLNRTTDPSFESLESLKVSSHILIKRTGEIIQYVPFDKRAWHAGKSEYAERKNFNDFSIGIELHGSVSDEFTDNQYSSLKYLIGELKQIFPSIKDSNILGHSEIAPKRKSDPGPNFKWEKIR